MKIYETKLFKKKPIFRYLDENHPMFFRKVRTDKRTFWENLRLSFYKNKEYVWDECPDPSVMRYGLIESQNLEASSPLEFLLFMGRSPDSIKRFKQKKREK